MMSSEQNSATQAGSPSAGRSRKVTIFQRQKSFEPAKKTTATPATPSTPQSKPEKATHSQLLFSGGPSSKGSS